MSCGEPAAGRFWHSPGHEGKREYDEGQGHEREKGHDDGGRAQEGEHVADGARGQGSNRSWLGGDVGGARAAWRIRAMASASETTSRTRMRPPGTADSGTLNDKIGSLRDFTVLKPNGQINYVDMAAASTNFKLVDPRINCIGAINAAYINPSLGMGVRKSGRTTNYTQGNLIKAVAVARNDLAYDSGFKDFEGLTIVSQAPLFAFGGDSGCILLKNGTNLPIGMLIAGNNAEAVVVPFKSMFSTPFKSGVKLYQIVTIVQ